MNRSVLVGALLLVASACSSGGSEPVADVSDVEPAPAETPAGEVAVGSELAGFAFDVRRDPG